MSGHLSKRKYFNVSILSQIFESIQICEEVKLFIDHSFAIANQIYSAIDSKALSLFEFSQLVGKSEEEVSFWTSGTYDFKISELAKIESVLEVNII